MSDRPDPRQDEAGIEIPLLDAGLLGRLMVLLAMDEVRRVPAAND
jgi:hypothetical protein